MRKQSIIFLILILSIISINLINALGVDIPRIISFEGSNTSYGDALYWQGHTGTDGSWLTGISTNLTGYAQYQFLNNNFNGSGNFTTSGDLSFNGLSSSDGNLTWDNVNKRLGIGTTEPSSKFRRTKSVK